MNKIALLLILISQSISAQLNVPIQKQINGNELFATLNTSQNDFNQLGAFSKHGLSESSFIKNEPSLLFKSFFGFSCIDQATGKSFTTSETTKYSYLSPGPLYDIKYEASSGDKINYKKIWVVQGDEIISHKRDFSIDQSIDNQMNSIYSWPGRRNPHFFKYNGFELDSNYDYAPFIDINKDGIYNPDNGDYPHLKTIDESIIAKTIAWRIENYIQSSFKFELRSSFWQLTCNEVLPINRTVFCSMEVINRAPNKVTDFKIFMLSDPDLGCYSDDYFGTDPNRNTTYFYNGDNQDGDSTGRCDQNAISYKKPPVLSLVYLNKNLDASLGLFGSRGNFSTGLLYEIFNPNYLINPRTKKSTTFEFSENPNIKGSWSMKEYNYLPTEIRVLSIHRKNDFEPNENLTLDYAYLLTKDKKLNNAELVDLALEEIDIIKKNYKEKFANICTNQECDFECVWPGDTNNDGVVNYLDAVQVFYGLNQIGKKRFDSLNWNALNSFSWNSQLPNMLNAKYADANGDGSINLNDLDAISKYYSFNHGSYKLKDIQCSGNRDSRFKFKDLKVGVASNYYQYNLILDTKEEVFQGISFEINIENSEYRKTFFLSNNIWIDNTISTQSYIENFSQALNHLGEKAVFFNNRQNDQRKDTLIKWRIRMDLDTSARSLNLPYSIIRICNGKLYMNDGQVIPIDSDTLHIPNSRFVSTHNVTTEDISFFPNPANNQIHFTHPELIESIIIYNLQGQLIKTVKTNLIESKLIIEDLNSGMYLLEIKTKDGRLIKKLSVNK